MTGTGAAPDAAIDAAPDAAPDAAIDALLDAVYRIYHHDFRSYVRVSIRRRIAAARVQLRCATLGELHDRTVREPAVFSQLLRFLTVQVTDMFRDPAYFRAIRTHVVPYLQTYTTLKVWVAGCATGEEAYSLAIMLAEEELLDRTLIYATDIDPESLRVAQAGVYDLERLARFSEAYHLAGGRGSLSDHYAAAYGGAVLDRRLRKAIVFADHSLTTDSAFAEVQLVSCRNVLIYFDRPLQDRTLGLLHDSLCHRGFLGLGMRESLRFSALAPAFAEVVPDAQIYRRR